MENRAGKLLPIVLVSICLPSFTHAATAPARSSHNQEGTKAANPEIDQDKIIAEIAEQRKQLSPIFEQEREKLAAINADRRMNSGAKKDAIRKIEKEYREKRNVLRLKIRMELRSRLLGENAR